MLRGSGERWSNRQWRSWMDLTSHLGVWSLSQEGKLLMDPDQSQGNIRNVVAVSGDICWWPGLCSDSGRGVMEVIERQN